MIKRIFSREVVFGIVAIILLGLLLWFFIYSMDYLLAKMIISTESKSLSREQMIKFNFESLRQFGIGE